MREIDRVTATPKPSGSLEPTQAATQRHPLFDRPNPIDYRPTRFETGQDKARYPGSVGEQIGSEIAKLFGAGQSAPASARPPPDVRFNPGLHARQEDLGSERTGDAYKAAPIAFGKAPGLGGEASRRISEATALLERRAQPCEPDRLRELLFPVRRHLSDLLRAEYAVSHGANPVQVEHHWPRVADSAYDLARRGLWHAEHQMQSCLVPGASVVPS